ncbi:DUF3080 family protein [Marinimicrobium agarilyticum]|uniref:DUF3080 family protein n=1 Tax=Marinimicrobium agarilyticum TaxID=306546 RepID=UPI00041FC3FA|nr:DUF3080 family protein [Marinimicrobium agarilyticum]
MRTTAFVFLLTLLCACQLKPPAEALLDDYLTRLSRVLDVDRPAVAASLPPRMPPTRALQITIEPLSIDLLDFWGFRKCGLAEVLGERNSVLGRVMVPSQHLHMDGRILEGLQQCRSTLEDETLLALTEELIDAKQAQWPLLYWNATAAAPELRAFWSPSSEPLVPGQEASYQAAETALGFLADLPHRLSENRWPERENLEAHYQALEQFELGGRLLQSLELGHHYIAAGNRMLEQAARRQTLCPAGLQKKELEYARNVMVKVFVGEVQPWLAAVNRRSQSLQAQYDTLMDQQAPDLREKLQPFETEIVALQAQFEKTLRQHVEHWQQLFDTCGSKARP